MKSNDRLHHMAEHRVKASLRADAGWVGRSRQVRAKARADGWTFPIDYPVEALIVWEVTDRHRRDAGASTPTLKVWLDGLRDAGILADDHHGIVVEERARVEVGDRRGVRIELHRVEPDDAAAR
ncbi:RusA family crossover junction endodeoxyribonuclease [Nakamurella leprariae]|uniref:hypothetical protein n=1 Tax=Nakamurella leprariae TaxID=2803911 RepID=UPI001964E14B|nr:hypothetical protein [Nakamurella leprariae]